MGWSRDTDNGRVCWFIIIAPKELMLITIITGGFLLIIVTILNILILRKALKSINHIQKTNQNIFTITNNNALHEITSKSIKISQPSKWKAVKVVTLTFGSFVITWGPYFIASLIYAYSTDEKLCDRLKSLIASPLAILGFLNSILNPMIYAWWHTGFRKFVYQKCFRRTKREMGNLKRKRLSYSTKKETSA